MLQLQKICIPDCISVILKAYFLWGYDRQLDGASARLTEKMKCAIIERGYRLYDGCPIPQDDQLTSSDVSLSISINSFVTFLDVRRFLAREEGINEMLAACDPSVCLTEAPEDMVDRIGSIIDELSTLPHIGIAKATKVLHKKRPKTIPLIDSYVLHALSLNVPWLMAKRTSFAQVIRAFREAQKHSALELARTTQQLRREHGIELSNGRALSFLIWNWYKAKIDHGSCTLRGLWGSQGHSAHRLAKQMWDGRATAIG